MESTPTQPSDTAEIANSLGAYVVRERPLKSLKGIGFISMLWVRGALDDGLFSNTRSYTVASFIASAGDCDGRYCFVYLASMAKRCGNAIKRPQTSTLAHRSTLRPADPAIHVSGKPRRPGVGCRRSSPGEVVSPNRSSMNMRCPGPVEHLPGDPEEGVSPASPAQRVKAQG